MADSVAGISKSSPSAAAAAAAATNERATSCAKPSCGQQAHNFVYSTLADHDATGGLSLINDAIYFL